MLASPKGEANLTREGGNVPEGRARSAKAERLMTPRLNQFSRSENW